MPTGKPKNKSVQHTLLHRLKIARGHLDHIIRMVEGGTYCIDIIHQSMAVQAALRSTDQAILRNHLQTCVADSILRGNKDDVVNEVMKVVQNA